MAELSRSEWLKSAERVIAERRVEINAFNVMQFIVAAIAVHAAGDLSGRALVAGGDARPQLALMSLWYAVAVPGVVALCGFLIHRCGRFIDVLVSQLSVEERRLLVFSPGWEEWKNIHRFNWLIPVGAGAALVALFYPLRVDLGILWGAGWVTEIILACVVLGIIVILAVIAPKLARSF